MIMKVIISHDIDHLSVWEHNKDFIIPKFITRASIELLLGKISITEYFLRYKDILKNKWQNLEELMIFNKSYNLPATFFIGVNNGVGLNYPLSRAEVWIKEIIKQGFEIGVHGIEYNNPDKIQQEYNTFKSLSGLDKFGIRMHYLRNHPKTLDYLYSAGYIFDSSIYDLKQPYWINSMVEFPLYIMDGNEIEAGKSWQSKNLNQAKETTFRKIELADKKNLKYLTILFHDRYFSDSFRTWKNWYIWLVEWLKQNNFEFISYREAINELKKN